MPDITLLPLLAGEFGVSIDELFDLTEDQKLQRIEKRIEIEEELASDVFREYEEFLRNKLLENGDRARILSLLANLYHHRMEADAKKVSRYAREAIKLQPDKKDCQWLLNMAEGQCVWDWNVYEHSSIIDFYKKVITNDKSVPSTPMPYYYLIDNLIADHRTKEAKEYLAKLETLPASNQALAFVYSAHIALAEFDEKSADSIIEEGFKKFDGDSTFLFEAAQYYAKKCDYERALSLYEEWWEAKESSKPRYTDALYGIAKIYGILGDREKLIATYDRIIDLLKNEWGFADDDKAIIEVEREKKAAEMKK
jgi:tetratricopeptide (TPR) repeat protein